MANPLRGVCAFTRVQGKALYTSTWVVHALFPEGKRAFWRGLKAPPNGYKVFKCKTTRPIVVGPTIGQQLLDDRWFSGQQLLARDLRDSAPFWVPAGIPHAKNWPIQNHNYCLANFLWQSLCRQLLGTCADVPWNPAHTPTCAAIIALEL